MNTKRFIFSFMMVSVALWTFAQSISNRERDRLLQQVKENYTKTEVMIPMRDGVKLHTSIYTPIDSTENLLGTQTIRLVVEDGVPNDPMKDERNISID